MEFYLIELDENRTGALGRWERPVKASRGPAHPERAVGDADASPGHHGCVLHGFPGHVGAAVSAVAIVLDCCLHRAALVVLESKRPTGRCPGLGT